METAVLESKLMKHKMNLNVYYLTAKKKVPVLPHIFNIFEKSLSKYLDLLQQSVHSLSAAKDLA